MGSQQNRRVCIKGGSFRNVENQCSRSLLESLTISSHSIIKHTHMCIEKKIIWHGFKEHVNVIGIKEYIFELSWITRESLNIL